MSDDSEALRLIEQAVGRIMARQHPGRPIFYSLGEVHRAVRRARNDLNPFLEEDRSAKSRLVP